MPIVLSAALVVVGCDDGGPVAASPSQAPGTDSTTSGPSRAATATGDDGVVLGIASGGWNSGPGVTVGGYRLVKTYTYVSQAAAPYTNLRVLGGYVGEFPRQGVDEF